MKQEMHHYTTSGLTNVWLKNGFEWRETKHGRALSIHDVDGLHAAISADIIEHSPGLTGEEFRFLRKELSMSQKTIANILGKGEQSVALWEKAARVPRGADLILRALYTSTKKKELDFAELVERLNELDRANVEREICLSDESGSWRLCA